MKLLLRTTTRPSLPRMPMPAPGVGFSGKRALLSLQTPPPFRPGCSTDAAGWLLRRAGWPMSGAGCPMRCSWTRVRASGCSIPGAGSPMRHAGRLPISRREDPAYRREHPGALMEDPAASMAHPGCSSEHPAGAMGHPGARTGALECGGKRSVTPPWHGRAEAAGGGRRHPGNPLRRRRGAVGCQRRPALPFGLPAAGFLAPLESRRTPRSLA